MRKTELPYLDHHTEYTYCIAVKLKNHTITMLYNYTCLKHDTKYSPWHTSLKKCNLIICSKFFLVNFTHFQHHIC